MNKAEFGSSLGQLFKTDNFITRKVAIDNELKIEEQRVTAIVNQHLSKIEYFDENFMSNKTNLKDVINNKEHEGEGLCNILSYFYCLFDNSYKIAQGPCKAPAGKNKEQHCWLEKGDIVYDPEPRWNNTVVTKKSFYKQHKINRNEVATYSSQEATANILKYSQFGSWSSLKKLEENIYVISAFSQLVNNLDQLESFYWHKDKKGISFTSIWNCKIEDLK